MNLFPFLRMQNEANLFTFQSERIKIALLLNAHKNVEENPKQIESIFLSNVFVVIHPMCMAIYPNILFAWSFEKYAQSVERIDRMAVIALFGQLIYWISLSVAMKIFSVESKNSKTIDIIIIDLVAFFERNCL